MMLVVVASLPILEIISLSAAASICSGNLMRLRRIGRLTGKILVLKVKSPIQYLIFQLEVLQKVSSNVIKEVWMSPGQLSRL